jgi:hypothetical protein
MPYNAPSWDLAAALYAARPNEGYFKLSGPGTITIHDDGRTAFTPADKGRHQYLMVDSATKDKILAAYVELASAKPSGRRFRLVEAAPTPEQPDHEPGKLKPPPKQ